MTDLLADFVPETAAEAVLVRLKQHGIDYLFANAGTDFAPLIETYARNEQTALPVPTPVTAPHETAAVAVCQCNMSIFHYVFPIPYSITCP